MIGLFRESILRIITFQTDRFLIVAACLLTLLLWWTYPYFTTSRQRKRWFWSAIALWVIGTILTIGVYYWTLPRGLSGAYYDNLFCLGDPADEDDYFDTPGRRIDRFIDFNANDFNTRYPFSRKSFSIQWEGSIYLPENIAAIGVESNFASVLFIDDQLITRPVSSIDAGSPGDRTVLGDGWSHDEAVERNGQTISYVWSSDSESDVVLGIDELADYRLTFRVMAFQYPGSTTQEVTVSANGVELETLTLGTAQGWESYSVLIPRAIIQQSGGGAVWVRFTYADPASPAKVLQNSGDTRDLAMALDTLIVEPISDNGSSENSVPSMQPLVSGFHHIRLYAFNAHKNPSIRLTWKNATSSQVSSIPEDFLFPQLIEREQIERTLPGERILLGASILYKMAFSCFIAVLLFTTILLPVSRWKNAITRQRLLLTGILVCALGVRLLFILEMRTLDPGFYILPDGTDHLNYLCFARGFFRGYWPGLTHEAFFQAPLISFYFILCSILFGESMTMLRAVTATLSVCSLLFVFALARKVFNSTVAFIAVMLCACNGVLIFYDTSLTYAPLIIFLNLSALWLMTRLRERLSWRVTVMLGIVLGVTAIARANIALLMPFLLLWMLFAFPGTFRQRIFHYVGICLVALLTILPFSLRNYYSSPERQWVWTNTNGGVTFWAGNNPSSTGMFEYSKTLQREVRQRIKKGQTSYSKEVLRFIMEQPREFLSLLYKKFTFFWRGHEIANNIPYYVFRGRSRLLSLPWFNFVLLGPLSIVGMALALKRWRECFLLYSFVIVQLMTTLLFFALARYRLPVVPVLSIFAASLLWEGFQKIRQKQWGRLLLLFASFAVLYALLNYPYAAFQYQAQYGEPMPWLRMLRYWDLFHIP